MDRGRTKGAVNVEGIRAGYLKIVKADTAGRERAAQEERKEGIATEDSVARPGERGAFKVMAFHWRCYKFICHNLLYAALLAYLYMPSSGHTQVPLARDLLLRPDRVTTVHRTIGQGVDGTTWKGEDNQGPVRHSDKPGTRDASFSPSEFKS